MLLIDELDRTDEPFEAFLLEVLADYQVTIPELGVVKAAAAADRRHHLQPHARDPRRDQAPLPVSLDRLPGCRARARDRATQVSARVGVIGARDRGGAQRLRGHDLFKAPGIAETLDWAEALVALDRVTLDRATMSDTLGVLLKYQDDVSAVVGDVVDDLVADAHAAAARE